MKTAVIQFDKTKKAMTLTDFSDEIKPGKVYSLFNASGRIEEIKPVETLPLYCKVFIYGFAMCESNGAIISAPDQHGTYKVVKISDYEPGFARLDKYSRPHSKKFGIGTYYADDLSTWPESTVKEYIKKAEIAEAKAKTDAENKANADKAERENLPKLYPYLTVNEAGDNTTTKNNMIAELKRNFPGVKFSVRKDHYSTYNVNWTNGPTSDEVTKITGKYEDHETDITGDFRDYSPSNFNRVFGGFDYVFENRHISEDLVKGLLSEFEILLGDYKHDYRDAPDQILYRILRKVSIPINAKSYKIVRTEITCGQFEEFYKITFEIDKPEAPAPVNNAPVNIEGLQLVDYSEKAAAVFGNTRPIKDLLKSMGGRFNPALNLDGKKAAGWIFPKSKWNELETVLFSY